MQKMYQPSVIFLPTIDRGSCDIDNEKVTKYYGSYMAFTKKKAALREDYIRHYAAQQREIKKTEAFIQKTLQGGSPKWPEVGKNSWTAFRWLSLSGSEGH